VIRREKRAGNRRRPEIPLPARWRSGLILLLFMACAAGLAGRSFYLQVLQRDFLVHQGDMRHIRTLQVPALRGAIVDRNGEPLALSAPTESIWVVPAQVLEAPDKMALLADGLDMSVADLKQNLQRHSERRFLYLARQLSPADAHAIMQLEVPGVFQQREFKRYYPLGEAAGQLVGLVDIDGRGQLGMERAKGEFLDGRSGSRRVIKDRKGRVVEDLGEFDPPEPGHRLRLTISLRLQEMAYRELKKACLSHDATSGMVVILDPHNGQLLALASYPGFNPNNRSTITPERMRERPIIDIFEPGSSIKPLLLARALESSEFSLDSRINTNGGRFRVGRLVITDYGDYGNESFGTILRKSSNIGAAKVGLKLGPAKVWQAYHDFGMGSTTGTGFPGERSGILNPYYRWGDIETATASYGYGVAVTALQLTRAYGAIANGGKLLPLSLIIGPGAHLQPPPTQVISPQTASHVRRMLAGVVSPSGTARLADIPGYSEGGKTGTARKIVNDGYSETAHQAVFVGMAPIDNPELVVLVLIDQPSAGRYYAGQVAAPVFADIMRKALRIQRVPPTWPDRMAGDLLEPEVS